MNEVENKAEGFIPRSRHQEIFNYRHDVPFVDMMPWPNVVRTVLLPNNSAVDVFLPANVRNIRLNGTAEYYVSMGTALKPATAIDNLNSNPDFLYADSILSPNDRIYYVKGVNKLSLIAPAAGCVVSVECWAEVE